MEIPILGRKSHGSAERGGYPWLAGMVLNLGIIPLFWGDFDKKCKRAEKSIPERNDAACFYELFWRTIEVNNGKGRSLSGRDLLNTILFVQCAGRTWRVKGYFPLTSDVRIIWGGREAVAQIQGLPRKKKVLRYRVRARNSLALIGRSELNDREKEELAYRLALDASVFEQRACTSPNTVFNETGGKTSPLDWAKAIAAGMRKRFSGRPNFLLPADEAYTVVNADGPFFDVRRNLRLRRN
jgi:hypothetical protein